MKQIIPKAVPQPTIFFPKTHSTKENLLVIDEKTVDVDLTKEMLTKSGKYIRLSDYIFEDPSDFNKKYRHMFEHARIFNDEKEATKLYVKKIESKIQNNEFKITVEYFLKGKDGKYINETEIQEYNLGKIKNNQDIISSLKDVGFDVPNDLDLHKKTNIELFQNLGKIFEGGGKHNVGVNLKSLLSAFNSRYKNILGNIFGNDIKNDEIINVDLIDVGLEPRISLLFADEVGKKTIITSKESPDFAVEASKVLEEKLSNNNSYTDVLFNLKEIVTQKVDDILVKLKIDIHALVANFSDGGIGNLIKSYVGKTSITFNSETPELGEVLQSILNTKLIKNDKKLKELYKKLELINSEISRIEEDLKDSRKDLKKIISEMKNLGYNFDENNNLVGDINVSDFYVGRLNISKGNINKNMKKIAEKSQEKAKLVPKAISYIAKAIELLDDKAHLDENPNILITNGPYGMSGLVYMYDYRVIAGEGVLETDTSKEDRIITEMVKYIEDKRLLSTDNKDTTGGGDSCMTAWLACSNYVGQVARENFYYKLFQKTEISPKFYRKSCAILESFYRLNFTKILSGVLFRLNEPNISSLSQEAIEKIYKHVDNLTTIFAKNDLEGFVDRTEDESNGYKMYGVDKLNNSKGRGSLEILCDRLGITDKQIRDYANDLGGIEHITKAKIELINKAWGRE